MLFLCCWCCENLVLLVRGVGVFKAVRVCRCSRQGRAFVFVLKAVREGRCSRQGRAFVFVLKAVRVSVFKTRSCVCVCFEGCAFVSVFKAVRLFLC